VFKLDRIHVDSQQYCVVDATSSKYVAVNLQAIQCNGEHFGFRKNHSFVVFYPPVELSTIPLQIIQLRNEIASDSNSKQDSKSNYQFGEVYFDDWIFWDKNLSIESLQNFGCLTTIMPLKMEVYSFLYPASDRTEQTNPPICIGTCCVDLRDFFRDESLDIVIKVKLESNTESHHRVWNRMVQLEMLSPNDTFADNMGSINVRVQLRDNSECISYDKQNYTSSSVTNCCVSALNQFPVETLNSQNTISPQSTWVLGLAFVDVNIRDGTSAANLMVKFKIRQG
jgi:hypothetical protein